MRISISFDGASEQALRKLAAALSETHSPRAEIGLDGPDHYQGQTAKLTPSQFVQVFARITTYETGQTIKEALDAYRDLRNRRKELETIVTDALQVFADVQADSDIGPGDHGPYERVKAALLRLRDGLTDS